LNTLASALNAVAKITNCHLLTQEDNVNPLLYLKAVIGAVGANVFPPIANYLMSFVPAPAPVQSALSILLVALLTGGAVYATPNKQKE
jgi:hypothetical protein